MGNLRRPFFNPQQLGRPKRLLLQRNLLQRWNGHQNRSKPRESTLPRPPIQILGGGIGHGGGLGRGIGKVVVD
ncbi:hypothetical protein LINPERPRIM_LOCUS23069 [Linum perenne]